MVRFIGVLAVSVGCAWLALVLIVDDPAALPLSKDALAVTAAVLVAGGLNALRGNTE